jgi:tetratricopeptide (TPR) repeat protein
MLERARMKAALVASRGRSGVFWENREFEATLAEEAWLIELLNASPAYGPNHLETIKERDSRAITLVMLKQREAAADEFAWVAQAFAEHPEVGPDHEDTVTARLHLGWCLLRAESQLEALAVFTDLEARFGEHPEYGLEHPRIKEARRGRGVIQREIMNGHATLAHTAAEEGRWEQAVEEWSAAVEVSVAHPDIGPADGHTALLRTHMALALHALGQEEEAFIEFNRAAAGSAQDGPAEPHQLAAREHRARLHRAAGRASEALHDDTWLVQAFLSHPAFGPDHLYTARARRVRAIALNDSGRHVEAVGEHRRVAQFFSNSEEPFGSSEAVAAYVLLAFTLFMTARYGEALAEVDRILQNAELLEGEEQQQNNLSFLRELKTGIFDAIPFRLADLMEAAALAHEEERFEHAVTAWAEFVELATLHPRFGQNHPDTVTAEHNRTVAMAARRRSSRVEDLSAPSFDFTTSIPRDSHERMAVDLESAFRRFQGNSDDGGWHL